MGRRKDSKRSLLLGNYISQKREEGGKIDIHEATQISGYSYVYLRDELLSSKRIIRKEILPRNFHEGSILSKSWSEDFEDRMKSLRFWANQLDEEWQKEVEELIRKETDTVEGRLKPNRSERE